MSELISVRKYQAGDEFYCQEILHEATMSILWPVFVNGTREITFEVIVLCVALMFIFFGFSIGACIASIPAIISLIIFGIWVSLKAKASELRQELLNIPKVYMSENDSCLWVAEAFEAKNKTRDSTHSKFTVLPEELIRESSQELNSCRKRIVGVIAVKRSSTLDNTARIRRLAVRPKYQKKGIGTVLIQQALVFCREKKFTYIVMKITECHHLARHLNTKFGFELKQMNQQNLISGLVTLTNFELQYSIKKNHTPIENP